MTLPTADLILQEYNHVFGSVIEWLKHRTDDQHGLGSKPTCAILLCPWERHFTALFPAWWSWQAVLNYSNISIKLLADSNLGDENTSLFPANIHLLAQYRLCKGRYRLYRNSFPGIGIVLDQYCFSIL